MSVSMRASTERATLFLRPTGREGRFRLEWLTVSFRAERELLALVETAARELWPGRQVRADASSLGERRPYGIAPGQILADGHVVALWGFTRRDADTDSSRLPPASGAAGALLDEPAGPAPSSAPEWAPPAPHHHRLERRP